MSKLNLLRYGTFFLLEVTILGIVVPLIAWYALGFWVVFLYYSVLGSALLLSKLIYGYLRKHRKQK